MTSRAATADLLATLKQEEQDFEWYPTTAAMIEVVARCIGSASGISSILDIGAGDGRVLTALGPATGATDLFAIEKAPPLLAAQPAAVIPVGTEFHEQDLMSLPADVVFSNPPYGEYAVWASRIIETANTERAFLILPRRWADEPSITAALTHRSARARVVWAGDFLEADRRSRAVVEIVDVRFPGKYDRHDRDRDPFNLWFDAHIDTFDTPPEEEADPVVDGVPARIRDAATIPELVSAYDEDYARMRENYRAIFGLDRAIFKELGIDKDKVRAGLKARMHGLKATYWTALFDRLEVITSRFTHKTRENFLRQITAHQSVAFTLSNAYAVTLWAVKFANVYTNSQLVDVFRDLSTHDGVTNYKSNTRTWEKSDWRYNAADHSHYRLDYRIVRHHYSAIQRERWDSYRNPGGLNETCHALIGDVLTVLALLGFRNVTGPSTARQWEANQWQDFCDSDGEVIVQAKAFMNGNLHLRFRPDAIRTLNIEAGRLCGWLRSAAEAATETGCTVAEAEAAFGAQTYLDTRLVRQLCEGQKGAES